MKIVILGGGPCGLGAAWRLAELNHESWALYEKNNYWGGLSASFQDSEGFWWDIGGHVLFSHYTYFDRVMDILLGKEKGWVFHKREAWVWMQNRFIPYPLQNNIHRLPRQVYWECLKGIIDIHRNRNSTSEAGNFLEWIEKTFGKGLARWFLIPYNFKVWAYPPEQMSSYWVGERVAPIDLERVLKSAVFQEDNISWGPNADFRFPRYGGTGNIWRTLASKLPSEKVFLSKDVQRISTERKKIFFSDGSSDEYDILISTIPLTNLLRLSGSDCVHPSSESGESLKYSSSHIVGLGLKGTAPDHLREKCWIYFPEDNCPFYRVTVFSNYSPNNVPDGDNTWSLMLEVSESPAKLVDTSRIVDDVIDGAINTRLIGNRKQVIDTWYNFVQKGYPTPSLERNSILFPLLEKMEKLGIYSRGRFGAWRYEVGNMDHSFMQGVEWVNAMLRSGEELTLWYPQIVNSFHPQGGKR